MIETANIRLLNCDCMEFMATCKDKEFDLAIVDPPYGINAPNFTNGTGLGNNKGSIAQKLRGRLNSGAGKLKSRKLNTSFIEWDNQVPSDKYFQELFRISKNQIICGGNYFKLDPTRCFIAWDKEQSFENFSQVEFIWTSFDTPSKIFRHNNSWGEPHKIHPTQKPIALYKFLLKQYAKSGNKILDTHGGSMSHAIAVEDFNSVEGMNLSLTIMEISKDYYEAALKRFNNHKSQTKLHFAS